MSKIIGIDLGTTNSCVAVMQGGKPVVIHSAEGRNVIPSVVEVEKNIVGDVAKRQMVVNPNTTIFSVKRIMGHKYSDKQTQTDIKKMPYKIVAGRDDMAMVEVNGREYTPQEISAKILAKIKADAEAYLGEKVTAAVITVPAYFDDAQRQATKQAGEIAGLEVKRIINEPTAAALAYGLDKSNAHTILVYDLGGGTFDVSVLELGDGVYEVKATSGDSHLGGDDFDQRIIDFIIQTFKNEQGIDLSNDKQALQRLKDAAEKAKIELSASMQTEISLPFITADASGPKHIQMTLTRAKFESIVQDLVDRTFESVKTAIKDSDMEVGKIDEIVLVGGQTRMPLVQEAVKKFFGKDSHKGINPDEVVAIGAAVQGGVLGGEVKDVLLLDVTPLSLGIETLGGVATKLITKNTTIPTSKSQVFSTAADNQTSVEVHVVQGEREMAADNKSLGRFILDGIPPAPRGMPQVEVTFDIDANGILKVSAKEKQTNKEQTITITGSTGLSKDEVEKMTREAEMHAEEDRKKKEEIEIRNHADALIFQAEKALKDAEGKISEEVKKEVQEKIDALKPVVQSAPIDEVKTKSGELNTTLMKIGEAMYSQGGGDAQAQDTGSKSQDSGGDKKDGDVQEGEVIS